MPANPKPNVDWVDVERRYKAGETSRTISRVLMEFGISLSRQAIEQRAERQGWSEKRPASSAPSPVVEAKPRPKIERAKNTRHPAVPAEANRRTEAAAVAVIAAASHGASLPVAASYANLDGEFLQRWLAEDESFRRRITQEMAAKAVRRLELVDEAAERGDVKATMWWLENAPITRTEFGKNARGTAETIKVVLNIRGPGWEAGDPTTTVIDFPQQRAG